MHTSLACMVLFSICFRKMPQFGWQCTWMRAAALLLANIPAYKYEY